jgi:hypothetical protein
MRKVSLLIVMALILGAAANVFAASGRGPDCTKNSVEYGKVEGNFAEEWYSYLERGESYLAGECFEPALADFEKAISLRTSLDRAAETPGCDQRRARSYGMHFQDWFGHRDKGVALFNLGRVDEAITELELSLKCAESSQAQFYLDKARQSKLKSSGGDTRDPSIKSVHVVTSAPRVDYTGDSASAAPGYDRFAAAPYYFTEDEIRSITEGMGKKDIQALGLKPGWGSKVVSWKAADESVNNTVNRSDLYIIVESEDDQGVQTVEAGPMTNPYTFALKSRVDVFSAALDEQAPGADVAADDLPVQDLFTIPLAASEGKAALNIAVTDIVGKKSTQALSLVVDKQGPQIDIQKVEETPGKAKIEGACADPSGIKSFLIGGVSPEKVGEHGFKIEAILDASKRIRFEALDGAGNKTTGVIVIGEGKGSRLETPTRWTRWLQSGPTRVAALDLLTGAGLGAPLDPWALKAAPAPARPLSWQPPMLAADTELNWNELQKAVGLADAPPEITLKTKPQQVYSSELYVEGTAVGKGSPLKQLLINDKNVLQGSPQNTFFNQIVYLRPGKNDISIKAVDQKGLTTEEKLPVTRVVPKVDTNAERLGVSMLPFYVVPDFKQIGDVAYDNLATALIEQRRFKFVNRSQVDAAVREMRLAGEGLTDPATAVSAGKKTSAEAIIIGTVRETETSIEVKAQVVDVETSRVMVTRDAFHQDKSLKNLQFITRGLASKIQNDFPIIQGTISSASGNSMTVDLGRKNRMIPGMKLVVFSLVPQKDAKGNPTGADTKQIGYGAIDNVTATNSTAKITKTNEAPKSNDLVITK